MATIDGNTSALVLEPGEVLHPFSVETALSDIEDYFLLQGVSVVGGTTNTTTVKIQASLVKAYLQNGLVSVDNQGRIIVGNQSIEIRPRYRQRSVSGAKVLELTYDGTNWSEIYRQNVTSTVIVDNLTSGGSTSALSAEQGKVLSGMIMRYEGSDTTNYPDY